MYTVTIENDGFLFYLRGTVWTTDISRAFTYESVEKANTALSGTKIFTKPKLFKLAKVVEVS